MFRGGQRSRYCEIYKEAAGYYQGQPCLTNICFFKSSVCFHSNNFDLSYCILSSLFVRHLAMQLAAIFPKYAQAIFFLERPVLLNAFDIKVTCSIFRLQTPRKSPTVIPTRVCVYTKLVSSAFNKPNLQTWIFFK